MMAINGDTRTAPAGQNASRPGHVEPAMPADIVARAQAAMRRANDPQPAPEAVPDEPGDSTGIGGVNCRRGPGGGPPRQVTEAPAEARDSSGIAAGTERTPDAPETMPEHHRVADVQQLPDPEPAIAAAPEPVEEEAETSPTPEPSVTAPPAPWENHSSAPGEQSPEEWRGYNPDYVADQMVPMIHARATTGWRSWLGLQPSQAEQRHKRLQAEMCANFGQPVKIVLANPRGYAGKTTMAICLAATLGIARGGGVCAFENHELRGVMSLRTVTNGTQRTTRDFINDLSEMTPEQVRHADLSRYVRHQHSGNYDAMVTSRSFEKQLTGAEYRAASALLGRFYQVIVVDTANNEAHEAFQAALEDATVLVVPTKWRPTHITPGVQMLNDMAARSPRHRLLVQNAVVVATNGASEAVPGAREHALPMFSSLAHAVIEIPPDPHIEADRPILHDQLRPATRRALDEFGAAVSRVAVHNINAMKQGRA